MAITQLKDGRWICYYRVPDFEGGKSRIKKEYFGRGPEAEAAALDRHKELDLKKRRPQRHTLGPAFSDLARSYLRNKTFNPNSRKHLKIRLQSRLLPFFGALPAVRIRDQDIDDYVHKRRRDPVYNRKGDIIRKGVKDATIARELTDLKAILNWAVRRRPPLIAFNPVAHYRKPKAESVSILPPSTAETATILQHAADHLKRAVLISYYTGLRPGAVELLTLTWDKVNWDMGVLLITSARKGGPEKRLVPIHNDFLYEMRRWYAADKKIQIPYIIHYNKKPINNIQTAWEGALKRAGITRRIRPYDLRHNFITTALEGGADLKALAEIVGSRPETLTRHYQHVTRSLHRKTISKIPPIEYDV